ncbi:hypothetical protein SBA4_3400013 [Candidatus Sulfopaludibacter sp. SbA4]|nr:hypothetical protein SBA4_3400013 [Candidatus Sulfopaludibacter sp. SbA4]
MSFLDHTTRCPVGAGSGWMLSISPLSLQRPRHYQPVRATARAVTEVSFRRGPAVFGAQEWALRYSHGRPVRIH